ncbi:MAG: hypothetical protein AB1467_04905 [Candidatus Diapherotrites archaeon]
MPIKKRLSLKTMGKAIAGIHDKITWNSKTGEFTKTGKGFPFLRGNITKTKVWDKEGVRKLFGIEKKGNVRTNIKKTKEYDKFGKLKRKTKIKEYD